MDWKKLALVSVRETRFCASRLQDNIADVKQSLHNLLEGYDAEIASVIIAANEINHIIADLFKLEGRLSRTK